MDSGDILSKYFCRTLQFKNKLSLLNKTIKSKLFFQLPGPFLATNVFIQLKIYVIQEGY